MQPISCLLDENIREALKKILRDRDGTAAIFDELPLMRGRGRADLAFVNGELCGFEIKSEADSLVRLGIQTENYERVFEFNTIVAAKKHIPLASKKLPLTWGIVEAVQTGGTIEFRLERPALRNAKLNNSALARLLWKNECQRILRKSGIQVRPNISVAKLWRLMEAMPTEQLCYQVREALKRRQARVALRHTPDGGLRTTVAIE